MNDIDRIMELGVEVIHVNELVSIDYVRYAVSVLKCVCIYRENIYISRDIVIKYSLNNLYWEVI